jgi:hypothetical protein
MTKFCTEDTEQYLSNNKNLERISDEQIRIEIKENQN